MTNLVNPYRFASGPTTLVYDEFTDTDSTALASHAPNTDTVGGGWTATIGTWQITSNKAAGSGSGAIALIDAGESDVVITGDVTFSNTADCFVGRTTDGNNLWLLGCESQNLANPKTNIWERTSGTWTERAATTMTGEGPMTSETWPLTVTLSGTSLMVEITINGSDYSASYSSSVRQTTTTHGMRVAAGASFDNFTVTA